MTRSIARKISVHLDWLCGGEVRLPGGEMLGWLGEDAYAYDESLCYLVRLLAYCAELTRNDRYLDEAQQPVGHLYKVIERDGGIGRDGHLYLFDTGICLSALAAHARVSRAQPHESLHTLADTMLAMISGEEALRPGGESPPEDRWSTRFGPHLIKLVIGLGEAAELLRRPELRGSAQSLAARFYPRCYRDGIFPTEADGTQSYLHGHCYAAEGLLYAVESGWLTDDGLLMKVGDQLSKAQMDNGGMQSWWTPGEQPAAVPSGPGSVREEVADTTAQAVRIWQCIDPKGFNFEIRRGLAFLKTQARKKGGIRYRPDSDHLNTWATVFYIQAMLFEKLEPDWQWII
jgi:hypothetical protein